MEHSSHDYHGHNGIKDLVQLGFAHQYSNDGIAATNRAEISVNKQISDARADSSSDASEGRLATAVASGEGRLTTSLSASDIRAANERAFGEIRQEVAFGFGATNVAIEKTSAANALAIEKIATAVALGQKDILLAVYKDGCETREKAAANFAALSLQACEDKHALAAKIAECCCEAKVDAAATRALILSEGTRKVESELAQANFKLLLASNSNGNSNGK